MTAGGCDDLIPALGQNRRDDGSDSPRGTRHKHLTGLHVKTVSLERDDCQHRGKSGGADRHSLQGREARRQRHQPLRIRGGLLRKAAPSYLAHTPPGQNHFVARLERRIAALDDGAREIDAGHVRILLHEAPGTRHDQSVFVVEGAVFHGNRDVACG